jgi:hypothetical protein
MARMLGDYGGLSAVAERKQRLPRAADIDKATAVPRKAQGSGPQVTPEPTAHEIQPGFSLRSRIDVAIRWTSSAGAAASMRRHVTRPMS